MDLKSFIRRLVRKFGYDAVDTRRFDRAMGAEASWPSHGKFLSYLMESVVADSQTPCLLQIGANDAVKDNFTSEWLERSGMRIALVEPNPSCVEKLRRKFEDKPNVVILPYALDSEKRQAGFYLFDAAEEKGIQLDVFSSFDRDLLEEKKRCFGLNSGIVAIDVPCDSMEGLSRLAGVEEWDIVVSDVEGFDHEVVRQVCALALPPSLFVFEHSWLIPEVRKACYRKLENRGYAILAGAYDTIAFRPPERCVD